MLDIDVILLATVIFLIIGIVNLISDKRIKLLPSNKILGYCTTIVSFILFTWVVIATTATSPVVSITYHDVIRHTSNEGANVDIIIVDTEDGCVLVNLNQTLGITIPYDGHSYKVARVTYADESWGLKLWPRREYNIVRD